MLIFLFYWGTYEGLSRWDEHCWTLNWEVPCLLTCFNLRKFPGPYHWQLQRLCPKPILFWLMTSTVSINHLFPNLSAFCSSKHPTLQQNSHRWAQTYHSHQQSYCYHNNYPWTLRGSHFGTRDWRAALVAPRRDQLGEKSQSSGHINLSGIFHTIHHQLP